MKPEPESAVQRARRKSASSDAPWWADKWSPPHRYDGVSRTAAYVTAKDGTKIATYRYLPSNLKSGDRIPAIIIITPYVSEIELTWLGKLVAPKSEQLKLVEKFARFGYATIFMDGRGSGASFGSKLASFMPAFLSDACDVVDWIVAQPWSNGKVGATGVSAVGLAAYWLAIGNHPAVKAIAPRFTSFDIFYDTHPGGLLISRFIQDIDGKVKLVDSNRLWEVPDTKLMRVITWLFAKSICPVDADRDRSLLNAAIFEHASNESLSIGIANAIFRDDQVADSNGAKMLDSQSPFAHLREIASSEVAVYLFAGWLDGAFSRAMLNSFQNLANPSKKIVIGPWNHGGAQNSGPSVRGKGTSKFDQASELARFFEFHLNGVDSGIAQEPPVHYFTMGAEMWKSASQWPPADASAVRLYFQERHGLSDTVPNSEGHDAYTVDFLASTGVRSRFGKHLTGDRLRVSYPDRRRWDERLLTYDSPVLSRDLEITGHPKLTLYVSSDCDDGAFLVYLEDVGPDGEVSNITDGVLSGRFRKISLEQPPYACPAPYRSLKRSDAMPIVPGEVMRLIIEVLPVAYLIAKGHRVRVALSGADRDNFPLLPPSTPPNWNVYWGGDKRASYIELPVIMPPGAAPSTRLFDK